MLSLDPSAGKPHFSAAAINGPTSSPTAVKTSLQFSAARGQNMRQ